MANSKSFDRRFETYRGSKTMISGRAQDSDIPRASALCAQRLVEAKPVVAKAGG